MARGWLLLCLVVLLALSGVAVWRIHRGSTPAADRPADETGIAALRAPFATRLASTRRPVARIALETMATDDPLASKVGGAPYLPRGEAMPLTADGEPMVLLAQVSFAEVPPMPGYPRAGMFQLFIPVDDDLYGMDVDDPDAPAAAGRGAYRSRWYPAPLLARDRLDVVEPPDTNDHLTPHDARRPRRMRFTAGEEEITREDVAFERTIGVDAFDYEDAAAKRSGVGLDALFARVFASGAGHKLGGYPFFTQVDPRPEGTPLRLLLQLDSDEHMLWGDSGVGNVFIDPVDLARADFSKVYYTWDCY